MRLRESSPNGGRACNRVTQRGDTITIQYGRPVSRARFTEPTEDRKQSTWPNGHSSAPVFGRRARSTPSVARVCSMTCHTAKAPSGTLCVRYKDAALRREYTASDQAILSKPVKAAMPDVRACVRARDRARTDDRQEYKPTARQTFAAYSSGGQQPCRFCEASIPENTRMHT